jgi:hypothetical protein
MAGFPHHEMRASRITQADRGRDDRSTTNDKEEL